MNSNQQPDNQLQSAYEDEVSVFDIVNALLRRKKLILGITVATFCIGLLYAFSQQRVYQVETVLFPSSDESIQDFNLSNLQSANKKDLYLHFAQSIESRSFREDFFKKANIIESLSDIPESKLSPSAINDIFKDFNESLKVTKDIKNEIGEIKITLEGVDKEKIGHWLDNFVVLADSMTVNQAVKGMQTDIDYKIKNIRLDIKNKRISYNQKLKDDLDLLTENYQIAKSLGIIERNDRSIIGSSKNNLSIYMSDSKAYINGTKVLQAEINAIKSRKSPDRFIKGLRELQEQLAKLESIKIEKGKLKAVTVDKHALVEVKPIRPKRILIAMLSLVFGGILGLFAVFIIETIANFKKEVNTKPDFDAA